MIPKCEDCESVYKGGFRGTFQKVIASGSKLNPKDFDIEIKIRPNELCTKCLKKILTKVLKSLK